MKLYTQSKKYKEVDNLAKKNMIEADAFNLMQRYLIGKLELNDYQLSIESICEHELCNQKEIIERLKEIIVYEAYQLSHGKINDEKQKLRERTLYFIEHI